MDSDVGSVELLGELPISQTGGQRELSRGPLTLDKLVSVGAVCLSLERTWNLRVLRSSSHHTTPLWFRISSAVTTMPLVFRAGLVRGPVLFTTGSFFGGATVCHSSGRMGS